MQRLTVVLALLGILNPYLAFAQTNAAPDGAPIDSFPRKQVVDIQLDATNRLVGQIVDGTGAPLPESQLTLVRLARQPSDAMTLTANGTGMFKSAPLAVGTYRLNTKRGVIICRCWNAKSAPPNAANGLLVVDDLEVVRGQQPISSLFRTEPLLIAALVTAAVAVPIAVHKSRDDAPEGS